MISSFQQKRSSYQEKTNEDLADYGVLSPSQLERYESHGNRISAANGDLTVIQSMGASVESSSYRRHSASKVPSARQMSPKQISRGDRIIRGSPSKAVARLRLQSEEMIIEKNLTEESEDSMRNSTLHSGKKVSENSQSTPKALLTKKKRASGLEALPIYSGDIRGSEPSVKETMRQSMTRLHSLKQHKWDAMNRSVGKFSAQSAVVKLSSDLGRQSDRGSLSAEDDKDAETPLDQCKHLKVQDAECVRCAVKVPFFGSVCDTRTIKTFIKVVYVDESKKQPEMTNIYQPPTATAEKNPNQNEIEIQDQGNNTIDSGTADENREDSVPEASQVTAANDSAAKAIVWKDFGRPTMVKAGDYTPLITMRTLYESYNPENTHAMREYMLFVINRNIKRMRKNFLISESVYNKFETMEPFEAPLTQAPELKSFLSQTERNWRTQGPDYLQFDSTLESGNLERAEVQPITQTYIERMRAQKQPVIQKYNLFCKVDTNTKGHQQWFYFKVKNTQPNTKYQFSVCNFTKPFSLFKQGMKIQMLSKRRQSDHIKALESEIEKWKKTQTLPDSDVKSEETQAPLSEAARIYMEEGLVTEQWEQVGTKIEYVKSKLERGGWNIPGPLNLDDEEEENVEQDDLNVDSAEALKSARQQQDPSMFRKRYFFQMNFELEFPFPEDTVYLAYSRPYTYSQILAQMFRMEEFLSALPPENKDKPAKEETSKRPFRCKILRKSVTYERRLLCNTICGLPVPKISITAHKPQLPGIPQARRQVIFVTARVHPGETSASTVFEGFFNSLVSQAESSPVLANFIVRLVPCMNPDGVVCGNYRSSLAGVDLNRQWILPNKSLHPEVFYTKSLMNSIVKTEAKKILIYCDIHCHSKKKNSFLYGCNTAGENAPFSTWTQVRLLPRLLARRSKYISLPSCRFGIEQCKLGTARVVVWKEFKVMNSFTLENSFYGYDHGPETRVYTQDDYREIGNSLSLTLNDYRVCLLQIQQEMMLSKGWLKPIKLKEITGIPAAEVIAREAKEHRLRKKKEDYIRRYHSRMLKERERGGHTFAPLASQEHHPNNAIASASANINKLSQPNFNRRNSTKEVHVTSSQMPPRKGSMSKGGLVASSSKKNVLLSELHEDHGNVAYASVNEDVVSQSPSQRKIDEVDALNQSSRQSSLVKQHSHGFKLPRETTYTLLAENQVSQMNWQERSGIHFAAQSSSAPSLDEHQYNFMISTGEMDAQPVSEYNDAVQPQADQQRRSSMMQIYQNFKVESHDENPRSQYEDDIGDLPGEDSVEQEVDMGDPWDQPIAEELANSPMRVKNWRQLFDEEELNRAYHNSIQAYHAEVKKKNGKRKRKSEKVSANSSVNKLSIDVNNKKNREGIGSRNNKQKLAKKDAQGVSTILVSDNDDDSDDDASVDNLHEVDLYSKVYLHKEKSIERAMRQTSTAHQNFIQEVKIMIKKKNRSPVNKRPQLPLQPFQKHQRLGSEGQSNMVNMATIQSNLSSEKSNRKHSYIPKQQQQAKDQMLQLTGVQIENVYRRPTVGSKDVNEDLQVTWSAKHKPMVQKFRKQPPQESLMRASEEPLMQLMAQRIGYGGDLSGSKRSSPKLTRQQIQFQQNLQKQQNDQQTPLFSNQQEIFTGSQEVMEQSVESLEGILTSQKKPMSVSMQQQIFQKSLQTQKKTLNNNQARGQSYRISQEELSTQPLLKIGSQRGQRNHSTEQTLSGDNFPRQQMILNSESQIKVVKKSKMKTLEAVSNRKKKYVFQLQNDPSGSIDIRVQYVKKDDDQRKSIKDLSEANQIVQIRSQDGKTPIGMQNFVLTTPGKEADLIKKTNAQQNPNGKEVVEYGKLYKGARLLVNQASKNNLNTIEEKVPNRQQRAQRKLATESQPSERMNEIVEGVKLQQGRIIKRRATEGGQLAKDSNALGLSKLKINEKSISFLNSPELGKSQPRKLTQKTRPDQKVSELVSNSRKENRRSQNKTILSPIESHPVSPDVRDDQKQSDDHIQDHISMTVSTLKKVTMSSQMQGSAEKIDHNTPQKPSVHRLQIVRQDSDTQSGIEGMMQSVLNHARDFDQNSFQEGQSSLLSQSAFRRYEESPRHHHQNSKDTEVIQTSHNQHQTNSSSVELVGSQSHPQSKKVKREAKIGKIMVKTREQGTHLLNNNNDGQSKVLSRKQAAEKVQEFECLAPKEIRTSQLIKHDVLKKTTIQVPEIHFAKNQPSHIKGKLSLHSHDKQRYRGNRFRRATDEVGASHTQPDDKDGGAASKSMVTTDNRPSITSEIYSTMNHDEQSSNAAQRLNSSQAPAFENQPQVSSAGVSSHQSVRRKVVPSTNQFQLYIQMSLQNLQDKALKEAYTRQIETNQKNRYLQPVNNGGLQSPSSGNVAENQKLSAVSISQRSTLFKPPASGLPVNNASLQPKLVQKRLSMQPMSRILNPGNNNPGLNVHHVASDHRLSSSPRKIAVENSSMSLEGAYPLRYMKVPLNSVVNDQKHDQTTKIHSTRIGKSKIPGFDQLSQYGLNQVSQNHVPPLGVKSSRQIINSVANLDAANSLPSISRNLDESNSNIGAAFGANSFSNHHVNSFCNEIKSSNNLSKADINSNYDSDEQRSLVNILHTSSVAGPNSANQSPDRNQKSRFLSRVNAPEDRFAQKQLSKGSHVLTENAYQNNSPNNIQRLRLKSLLQNEFTLQPAAALSQTKAPYLPVLKDQQRSSQPETSKERLPTLPFQEKVKQMGVNEHKQYHAESVVTQRRLLNRDQPQPVPVTNSKSLGQSRADSPSNLLNSVVRKVHRDKNSNN